MMTWKQNSNGYILFYNDHSNGTNRNTARCNWKRKIQDGDLKTGCITISACIRDKRTISTENHMFQMPSIKKKRCDNLNQSGSRNANMAIMVASKLEIHISQLDRNEITTNKPTVSSSSNRMGLVQILSD